MPQDSETDAGLVWAGVVDVQPAPGAKLKIGLGDHPATLVMLTGRTGGNQSYHANRVTRPPAAGSAVVGMD
jgi:hypothetical protein